MQHSLCAGELVVFYLLHTSINGISLHNNMFLHEYLPFFKVILKNIITTGISLLNITILHTNCSSNMPTNENHSKTVIYNYF